jgi:hypothetical protein
VFTVRDIFDEFAPFIPPSLVTPTQRERIRRAASRLSAAATHRVYLECRGADAVDQVDLIADVEPPPFLRDIAARAWLEYDIPSDSRAAADDPGIFIDLKRDVARAAGRPDTLWRVMCALDAGWHARGNAHSRGALERCVHAMPPHARLLSAGVFPSRGDRAMRLCVTGLGAADVMPYLTAIEWSGSAADRRVLARVLDLLASHPDHAGRALTILHVDIGARVGATLGVERALSRGCQLRGRIDDDEILDALVSAGWCGPAKRAALASWPGASRGNLPHELWESALLRRVNHVKLAVGGGKEPATKLYLCASVRYLNSRVASIA